MAAVFKADDFFASVEERMERTSAALSKMCGHHVAQMTPEQAQEDVRQGPTGYGKDYAGVKASPVFFDDDGRRRRWRRRRRRRR